MALAVKYAGFDTCSRLFDALFSCDSTLEDNETAAHCAAQPGSQKKVDFILQHSNMTLDSKWKNRLVHNLMPSSTYAKPKKDYHSSMWIVCLNI